MEASTIEDFTVADNGRQITGYALSRNLQISHVSVPRLHVIKNYVAI